MMKKLLAALLAASLLAGCGCAREGFYEAVGKTAPSQSSSEPASSDDEEDEGFEVVNDLIETDDVAVYFCVPDTGVETSAAAAVIEAAIRSMAQKVADSVPEGGSLAVYDGQCDNNSKYFSAEYEAEIYDASDEKTQRRFGVVYSAVTGEPVKGTDVFSAEQLAARMLDESLSTVRGKTDEEKAAARDYLSELGSSAIVEALKSMTGGFSDGIPTWSYTVEDGDITVMINTDTGAIMVRCPDAAR
jgi:hypothetical protein